MKQIRLRLKENEISKIFKDFTNIIESYLSLNFFPTILLSGDLGAGKTTFVRQWMSSVGSNDLVNSPTFALQNVYQWNNLEVHHFDLYRIKFQDEIDELGFQEIWGNGCISFIEWWPNAINKLPTSGLIRLEILHDTPDSRIYVLESEY
jgi:tRNA threonylcarbamoyladenosine biosynthesis protein TsaE